MAKFKIVYKQIDSIKKAYINKEITLDADDVASAKDKFLDRMNKIGLGYDGVRRPRLFIQSIKEIVEEDGATQASNISGPTSLFGTPTREVSDVYKELLNLEDYN